MLKGIDGIWDHSVHWTTSNSLDTLTVLVGLLRPYKRACWLLDKLLRIFKCIWLGVSRFTIGSIAVGEIMYFCGYFGY